MKKPTLIAAVILSFQIAASAAHAACDNASPYGVGSIIGGALGAFIGSETGGSNLGIALGTAVGSQAGRCTESGINTRRAERRSPRAGRAGQSWIETDASGRETVCQYALVQVHMPTGQILTDRRKICQGVDVSITASN